MYQYTFARSILLTCIIVAITESTIFSPEDSNAMLLQRNVELLDKLKTSLSLDGIKVESSHEINPAKQSVFNLTDISGTVHNCIIQHNDENDQLENKVNANSANRNFVETDSTDRNFVETAHYVLKATKEEKAVIELLSSLKNKCWKSNAGWWTYEFCFQKHIKQIHFEPVTKVDPNTKKTFRALEITQEFFLGFFNDSIDTNNKTGDNNGTLVVGKDPSLTSFREHYGHGSNCLTAEEEIKKSSHNTLSTSRLDTISHLKHRITEVRYVCHTDWRLSMQQTNNVESILSVREIATCQYILEISIPLLCNHPSFKQKVKKSSVLTCDEIEARHL